MYIYACVYGERERGRQTERETDRQTWREMERGIGMRENVVVCLIIQLVMSAFQSLKSETSLGDNDDTILFSDDEPAGFELGSQVERIEHFLLGKRLKVNKGQRSKSQ